MDAAHACNVVFILESWKHRPWSRGFCPIDYREQLETLRDGTQVLYRHFPPLGLQPLGIATAMFGDSERSLRLTAIAMSLFGLGFGFLWIRRSFGLPEALAFGAFLALNGHAIHYSRNSDALIMNSYLLPLMALLYLRYLDVPNGKRFFGLLALAAFAMWSDWNSYAVFGAILIYHVFLRGKVCWDRVAFAGLALIPSCIVGIMVYFSVVSGGWEILWADFTKSMGLKTDVSIFRLLDLEVRRIPNNMTVVVCLCSGLFILFHRKWLPERMAGARLLIWLCLASFAFPLFSRRVTLIHEYWVYWSVIPMSAMTGILVLRAWPTKKWLALLAVGLFLLQSGIIYQHRIFKYDSENLLARHQGKAFAQKFSGGILITDLHDLHQTLRYYSRSEICILVESVDDLKQCEKAYHESGRSEPMIFMTSDAQSLRSAITDLQRYGYPYEKLTGEFHLREGPDELSKHLEGTYAEKIHEEPYTYYIRRNP